MEIRISFSNVVGKRLALGYTHYFHFKKALSFLQKKYILELCIALTLIVLETKAVQVLVLFLLSCAIISSCRLD